MTVTRSPWHTPRHRAGGVKGEMREAGANMHMCAPSSSGLKIRLYSSKCRQPTEKVEGSMNKIYE